MAFTAIPAEQYNNAVPGLLQGIDASSIYDIDSTPRYAIGTGFKRHDGNIYRYCSFATGTTGITQGVLVSQTVSNTCSLSTDALVIAPVVGLQQATEQNGTYPGMIGSRFVVFTLASTIVNQFAGGYLSANKDTGYGYTYRIKSNTASATVNSNANAVILELYSPLQVALDTATDISVIGCLYNDLVKALVTTNHIIVGVTCANFATATTSAPVYGWICTHGVCTCLTEGTVTNGDMIQPSIKTSGAFCSYGVGTSGGDSGAGLVLFGSQPIGFCIDKTATAGYSAIFLSIE